MPARYSGSVVFLLFAANILDGLGASQSAQSTSNCSHAGERCLHSRSDASLDDGVALIQVLVQRHEKRHSKHSFGESRYEFSANRSEIASKTVVGSNDVIVPSVSNVPDQNSHVTAMHRYPAIFHGLQELLESPPRNVLKILSFGCSDGSELRTLREYFPGATLHGVDIDAALIAQNNANNNDPHIQYFHNTKDLAAETYDAVLAMGILCRQRSEKDRLPYDHYVKTMALIDQLVRPGGYMVVYNANFPFKEYPYSYRYQNMAENCNEGLPTTMFSADTREAHGTNPQPEKLLVRGVCAPWGKYCIESGWLWKFSYLGDMVQPVGNPWASFGCMHPGTFFKKLAAIPDLSHIATPNTIPIQAENADRSNQPGLLSTNNPPESISDLISMDTAAFHDLWLAHPG
jgi:hypothetical protein